MWAILEKFQTEQVTEAGLTVEDIDFPGILKKEHMHGNSKGSLKQEATHISICLWKNFI